MAMNEIEIDAPPERVFAVLSDPERYEDWVMGTSETEGVGDAWPEEGSKLRWEAGVGPLKVSDYTEVVESDAPRRLVLRARMRPLGESMIDIHVDATDRGSRVTLFERPTEGLMKALDNPLSNAGLGARNVVSLDRLKAIVESS